MKIEENQCTLLKAEYKIQLAAAEALLLATEKAYETKLAAMKTIVANY